MPVVVGLTFAFLAIVVLGWPILRRRRSRATRAAPPDAIQEALRRRDRAYDEIKTLILDHELGNVPDDEYERKLAAFRIDAARAIRDLEQLRQASAGADDAELEKEVLELRRSWGSVKRHASPVKAVAGMWTQSRCSAPGARPHCPEGLATRKLLNRKRGRCEQGSKRRVACAGSAGGPGLLSAGGPDAGDHDSRRRDCQRHSRGRASPRVFPSYWTCTSWGTESIP